MGCWGNYDNREDAVSICPECGEPVDDEGLAVYGCRYSPEACSTCHDTPCDGSC